MKLFFFLNLQCSNSRGSKTIFMYVLLHLNALPLPHLPLSQVFSSSRAAVTDPLPINCQQQPTNFFCSPRCLSDHSVKKRHPPSAFTVLYWRRCVWNIWNRFLFSLCWHFLLHHTTGRLKKGQMTGSSCYLSSIPHDTDITTASKFCYKINLFNFKIILMCCTLKKK